MQKNKLKYLLLIFSCFLFTGCSAEYNLNILYDLSIYESLTVQDGVDKYNKADDMLANVKSTYGHAYTIYQHVYSEEFKDTILYYGFDANRNYSSYNDLSSSQIINEYFGDVVINRNGNKYTLTANPGNQIAAIMSDVNYVKASLDELNINITVPFKVISHNADSVNSDVYTWHYHKNDYDRKLELVFDNGSESDYNENIDNKDDNTTSKSNNSYFKYIFLLIGMAVIAFVIYLINKKDKNNSI